jgi:hypothetical protein
MVHRDKNVEHFPKTIQKTKKPILFENRLWLI